MNRLPAQQFYQRRFNPFAAEPRQLATPKESTFPVDQSQQPRFAILADYGVDFPAIGQPRFFPTLVLGGLCFARQVFAGIAGKFAGNG